MGRRADAHLQPFGRSNQPDRQILAAGKTGTLAAPIAVGAAWDIGGPWGAFMFVAAASWLVVLALWIAPTDPDTTPRPTARAVVRELTQRLSDYVRAFSLIAIPTVAFVVVMSALRISSAAIQTSFYVVYLRDAGMIGTVIGVLVAISEGAGLLGAIMADFWERYFKPHWVFIGFVVMSLACVSITPRWAASSPCSRSPPSGAAMPRA